MEAILRKRTVLLSLRPPSHNPVFSHLLYKTPHLPLFLDETKNFLETAPPPPLFSKGLDDRTTPPAPHLSQGLDPALQKTFP